MIADHRLIKVLLLSLLGMASNAMARDAAPANEPQIGVGQLVVRLRVWLQSRRDDRCGAQPQHARRTGN
jgi:hypothetical protein